MVPTILDSQFVSEPACGSFDVVPLFRLVEREVSEKITELGGSSLLRRAAHAGKSERAGERSWESETRTMRRQGLCD